MSNKTVFGIRLSAIGECLFFLSLMTGLEFLFGEGDRFSGMSLHPYWIIVLIVTVQYGTTEGIAAAVLSTLFLYAGNVPEQKMRESDFEYQFRLTLLPFLWFVTAYVLGEIRMRAQHQNRELIYLNKEKEKKLKTISDSYEKLKETKENLETKLAGQLRSIALSYKTFTNLETHSLSRLLLSMDKVVDEALNPKKFSVFALGENGFEVVTSHGWSEQDRFSTRISSSHPLYRELLNRETIVCVVNEADAKILQGEGVLAGLLREPSSGEVFGMLKIEEIDFYDLNVSNLEIFKRLCEIIGSAYVTARDHKELKMNSVYSDVEPLYSSKMLELQKDFFRRLGDQYDLHATCLRIRVKEGTRDLDSPTIKHSLFSVLKKALQDPFQVFESKTKKGGVEVFLPFVKQDRGEKVAAEVLQRLTEEPSLKGFHFVISVRGILSKSKESIIEIA